MSCRGSIGGLWSSLAGRQAGRSHCHARHTLATAPLQRRSSILACSIRKPQHATRQAPHVLLPPAELCQALCSCSAGLLLLLTAGVAATPVVHAATAATASTSSASGTTLSLSGSSGASAPSTSGAASASNAPPGSAPVSSGAAASDPGCGSDGLCGGEVNGTLNTCGLTALSCVSVMSDDAEHFVAPWEYELPGGREAAVEALVAVATGGAYEPVGLSSRPYVTNGYSRLDAAAYMFKSAASAVTGGPAPSRPQPLRDLRGFVPFDGVLVDRHVTADGGIYVRIVFGSQQPGAGGGAGADVGSGLGASSAAEEGGQVLDAEFLFPQGDSIVTLRCAERAAGAGAGLAGDRGSGMMAAVGGGDSGAESEPSAASGGSGSGGRLVLSFDSGLTWDTNTARRQLESLRKALRWQVVPVVAEFDPKFNNDRPLWFERLYTPFRSVGASVREAAGGGGGGGGDPLLD
ncbi:hypothetical protein HXX76_015687 [Chlamydomonas incerta]|uniref:Uncharacterized protein n=1 Tax=Chlamydomonas incerta TaxID=51695 RepID=A0A835VRP1_CHLIN|nr:hypothetical protein HXX76_015687 [Chlamydomonas incerta]|eukprot:KAG2422936.1 hypothetical protein HXX76_015687 [Chlamydomonas incerta]